MRNLRADRPIIALSKGLARRARRWPVAAGAIHRARARSRHALLELMPTESVCAEIGVWQGSFSRQILERVRPRELHLVDPWIYQGDAETQWHGGNDGHVGRQADMDRVHAGVRERFADRPEVRIHRFTAHQAASRFPDEYFDWIYIDGDHSFEHALSDVRDYLPKVKRGGYLAGDDFHWAPEEGFPVRRVVESVVRAGEAELAFQRRGQWALLRA